MKIEAEFISADQATAEEDTAPTEVTIAREPWEQTLSTLSQANTSRVTVPRTPASPSRNQVVDAFHDAFQLIGGVPRLALWANDNPGEFFRLYSKLLPRQAEAEIKHDGGMKIVHVLPKGRLDE